MTRPVAAWRRLLHQFVHFFALMLWVAGTLAFVAGMPQLGVAIFVVIVVNGVFAFAQEHRAERAAAELRDLLPRRALVVRDGARQDIDASQLVVDDLVVLRPGDRISADLTVLEGNELAVDASMLTGESTTESAQRGGRLFAGCFLVHGEGTGLVSAVGASTRLASITRLTQSGRRPRSPLEHELNRVVRTIALIAISVGLAFFGISLLVGGSPRAGFLFAVGVTVALVPEGLLPTVTLSLAVGAQEMARHHALVRHLESVETLGSTTFICSDKTGTITENRMAVVEAWTPRGTARISGTGYEPAGEVQVADGARSAVVELARVAARCSEDRAVERSGAWVPEGDPTEAALFTFARRCGLDREDGAELTPDVRRIPFDEHRRMMSVIAGGMVLTKGAPETVLSHCRPAPGVQNAVSQLTRRGLRVLAVASRPVRAEDLDAHPAAVESELDLLGLVGIEDPPRQGVRDAIASCRREGVRIAMLTGDNPQTAAAIAREVGLIGQGGAVLVGGELPDDPAVLGAMVDREDGVVISRVTPEDKLRIATALQQRGHVVAMTGDGVNDGPALQTADIGVAMGASGTDVARAAADLVLLDDDFRTIIEAVRHGKVTFANIRRFLTYHLVGNMAELTPFVVWAVSAGRFPLALGVLQILCFDLGADVVPALALGIEHPSTAGAGPSLRGRHLVDGKVLVRAFGVLGPAESVVELAAFCVAMLALGWVPGHPFPHGRSLQAASGTAFATVLLGQIAVAFGCRSATRWAGALGWFSNRLLLVGVAVALALLGCLLYVPILARVLGQAPPPAAGWAMAVMAVPVLLAVDAAHKAARRARRTSGHRRRRGFTVLPVVHSGPGSS